MRIARVELRDFRSFAHCEWKAVPPDLAVIVGPNGSGKTNLIQAIRLITSLWMGLGSPARQQWVSNGRGAPVEPHFSVAVDIILDDP
jgi:recombinational DNA repair ATPase RecF